MARCARHRRARPALHVLLWFTAGRNPDVTAGTRLRLKDSSLFL